MGADQMRDMDAGDPLLAQCLRDRAGLGMTELGEPRPGEGRVQRPGDIVRGLTMTDEKKTHGPDRTGRSCAFYGPEVNVPCRSARGQHLEAVPEAIAGVEAQIRSEEHTSELQSRGHLVCRLLLEKKNTRQNAT